MKITVSHILVRHQYESEDILRSLADGKDFADLARKHSICPSAPEGGALGTFSRGRMDEDFEEAAFALKPGEISKSPIRTRFGYHLIKRIA